MNKLFVIILVAICIVMQNSCALIGQGKTNINHVNNEYYTSNNCDTCAEYVLTIKELDRIYLAILNDEITTECLMSQNCKFGSTYLSLIPASIYNIEKLDYIVILFYMKEYYQYLLGNNKFSNLSCCYSENPVLFFFFYHFFKMSQLSVINVWFTKDVYNWAITQERFWQNEDIKKVFEQIQEKLNNQ